MTTKFLNFIIIISCMILLSASKKRSFVIVTDTTGSMRSEIITLRNNIQSVVNTLPSSGDFENYVLVPFNDPDVGVPKISPTPEGLINFLNEIYVKGGNDCLENSLAAVEKALEITKDYSSIFLFTDAPAKDINKLSFIQNLCRQRQSQIVTFLSGDCPGHPINNVYDEIAKSCYGTAFHLDEHNLQLVFKYMKEIVNVAWTDIQTHKEFTGRKQFNFNIDAYTKDLIVAVAGDFPEIQVTNADGESAAVERIMDTKRSLVIRLLQPPIGEYVVEICSRGISMATFYKWKTLQFRYGFSPKKPNTLNETTNAPLPDTTSFLVIEQLDSGIEVEVLELSLQEDRTFLELKVLSEDKRLYMVQAFFIANKPYQINLLGRNKNTQEMIRGTSKIIYAQSKVESRALAATVEAILPESTLVEFTSNLTLYCKVKGDPKPEIWWEDDNGNRLESEDAFFEWPYTYISYTAIENATTNGTIYCKSKNSEGESSLSAEVFIHREFIFEIIQKPTDITIEYGSEGRLFCEAVAYPEATIKWYHNDTSIENTENVEIVPDDNMLLIKNMSIEDTGEYRCDVENSAEMKSLSAVIDISGLEAPSIEITSSEYFLKPGDSIEVECQITKGNPAPEVIWKMEVEDDFVDVPDDISVDDNILKISSAKGEYSGRYKCSASNIVGEDSKEVTIEVQYAPIIKNGDEIRMVNAGESVQLDCEVHATPKATVHWDMYQDDVIIAFDDRHSTDDKYTHRFIAQPYDSGTYYCVAENEVGRTEKKVTVIILEAPFIEPLEFKTLRARVGSSLQVPCNVSLGRPVPITRWEHISTKSVTTVLVRKTTSKLDLVLRDISRANEGYYQCVTENTVGPDSVKFYLTVTQ